MKARLYKITIAILVLFNCYSASSETAKAPIVRTGQECDQYIKRYIDAVSGLNYSAQEMDSTARYIRDWWKRADASSIADELMTIYHGKGISYGTNLYYSGISYVYSNKRRVYQDPGFLQPSRAGVNSAFYKTDACAGSIDLREDLKILRDDLNEIIPMLKKIKAEKIDSFSIRYAIDSYEKVLVNADTLLADPNF